MQRTRNLPVDVRIERACVSLGFISGTKLVKRGARLDFASA